MGRNNLSGAWGEAVAAQYLKKKHYTLVAAGYELDLFVTADPVWEDYRDSYGLTLDGTVTQVPAGSVMTREGVWYVTGSFLQQTLGASVTWDADESTLILRVADKSMAVD